MKHLSCLLYFSFILSLFADVHEEILSMTHAGNYEDAAKTANDEIIRLRKNNDAKKLIPLLITAGAIQEKVDAYEKAAANYVEAMSLAKSVHEESSIIATYDVRAARAFYKAEKIQMALSHYDEAIQLCTNNLTYKFSFTAEKAELLLKNSHTFSAWELMQQNPPEQISAHVLAHWFSVKAKVFSACACDAEAYDALISALAVLQKSNNPQKASMDNLFALHLEAAALAHKLSQSEDATAQWHSADSLATQCELSSSSRWSLAALSWDIFQQDAEMKYAAAKELYSKLEHDKDFVKSQSIITAQARLCKMALSAKHYNEVISWSKLAREKLPPFHSLLFDIHANNAAAYHELHNDELATQEAAAASEAYVQWMQQSRILGNRATMMHQSDNLDAITPIFLYATKNKNLLLEKALANTQDAALAEWLEFRDVLFASADAKNFDALLRDYLLEKISSHEVETKISEWQKQYKFQASEHERTLPNDTALVQFFLYNNLQDEPCYAALIKHSSGTRESIELGKAQAIHQVTQALLTSFESLAANPNRSGTSPLRIAERLYDMIWRKISTTENNIIIRPAGMLHFIPWSVLRDKNVTLENQGFLCQKYQSIRIAASDYHTSDKNVSWKKIALCGVSDFSPQAKVLPNGYKLMNLPGVADELQNILSIAPQTFHAYTNPTSSLLLESNIYDADVLHIATHGFSSAMENRYESSVKVLQQSGIIFHNYTGGEEGVMTVDQIISLPYQHKPCVVLSLCRGGLGDVQRTENWSSMRRAFIAGGAEQVLAVQWEIVDHEAQLIMTHFYKNLLENNTPQQALQKLQCSWLNGDIEEAKSMSIEARATAVGAWTLEVSGW